MAEPLRPWVRPGGRAVLEGLKSRPELNGQEVTIQVREVSSGRWRCKVAPFGEEMKFKAENLAETPEKNEPISVDANWLRRGVQAAVKDLPEHEGQVVRVVTVDGDTGRCKCVLRTSGEAIEVSRKNLRPLANATAPEPTPAPKAEMPKKGGTDWAAVELERRRLAEGFRSGFEEGASVTMEGLQSMPELNGQSGKLLTWDGQSMRWRVHIEGVGIKSFRPQNLIPQESGQKRKAKNGSSDQNGAKEEHSETSPEKKQRVEDSGVPVSND